jgi:hypothetical protein
MTEQEQQERWLKGNREAFLQRHPEYHLYRDLQTSLPKFMRQATKISNVNWEKLTPLNHRGLPF